MHDFMHCQTPVVMLTWGLTEETPFACVDSGADAAGR